MLSIIFDVRGVGLGNNGGSRTIIRSANTLNSLGHNVKILDSSRSNYTWDRLNVPHIIWDNKSIIDSDFIIATGVNSVKYTLNSDKRFGRKLWYMRGWETWTYDESRIIELVKNRGIFKFVNGVCLKNKLLTYGEESEIIYPGYDFDEIFFKDMRKNDDNIVIGGLLNFGKKRNSKRSEWILGVYNNLIRDGHNVNLRLYGCEGSPTGYNKSYIHNPTTDQKNKLYNSVDVWLAPTELEGLHVAAAEAMSVGCAVVGTDAPMNGMDDYLIHAITGLKSMNNFQSFYDYTRALIMDRKYITILGNHGRDKITSIGSRKDNMSKLVKYLGTL